MKILLLEPDPKDSLVIRETLEKSGHHVLRIETSEQAWPWIEQGEALFLIADWDASDLRTLQFIPRARSKKLAAPLYILLMSGKSQGEDAASVGADDILHKPFSPQELKNRIAIGERILSLAGRLAQARDQLESSAIYDSLTGLMNRGAFYRQASGELERARRASLPISLIALGIDNIQAIRNTYGEQAGEQVFAVAGRSTREKSRPYDCIGRWSEAEFVLALPGVIGAEAEKIAERILAGIHAARIEAAQDTLIEIQGSAGIACLSRISSSTELEPLIQQARQALARAREGGGNRVALVLA